MGLNIEAVLRLIGQNGNKDDDFISRAISLLSQQIWS
jgi:hypothetical protein